MEGDSELIPLAGSYDVAVHFCQRAALVAQYLLNIRGSDESHRYVIPHFRHSADGIEASQLASVGIAAHSDVHRAEMSLREQYHTGAGAEDGQTVQDVLPDGFQKTQFPEQPHLHGALASRQYESVFPLQPVFLLPHLEALHSEPLQRLFVFYECPLQGQYSNSHL